MTVMFIEFLNIKVFDNPSIVQFIHRNLAYLIVGIYFYILFYSMKERNKNFRIPIIIIGVSLFFTGGFRNFNYFIWSKNFLCIFTPDKFYFNYSLNIVFSLYFKL